MEAHKHLDAFREVIWLGDQLKRQRLGGCEPEGVQLPLNPRLVHTSDPEQMVNADYFLRKSHANLIPRLSFRTFS